MEALKTTARITVMIFALIIGAMIFNTFIAFTGIPDQLNKLMTGLAVNRYLIIAFILLTYFFFGCIMDALAMAFLLLPIYYPIVIDLGFDGIWFGVVATIMAEIGLLTPPIGLNCFVVHGVFTKYPVEEIFLGILPYVVVDVIIVIIITILPQIALFLPSLMK
jgi:TRAP-type C4-dicarboxylate transport system permease large subunit